MLPDDDNLKRYYTISEVAELFHVSKSLIRFWDTEFALLKPHKNSKGERRFTQENLEQFQLIYHLVKERGFTLAGARQEIQDHKERLQGKMEMIRRLRKIRVGLEKLGQELGATEEE